MSRRLITWPRYSICITELATEMPRCFSISIQSEVAWRVALRAFTLPAMWIAPAKRRSFSVSVVFPASGWEMIAKVRRRAVSCAIWDSELMNPQFYATPAYFTTLNFTAPAGLLSMKRSIR